MATSALDKEGDLNVVGKDWARLDGADKVSGRSIFADDVRVPGMLAGKIVRSPYAHARIVSIDTSAAEALPGVKAVITAADTSDVKIGINQPLLPVDTVIHVGHEVAAVAAINEEVAAAAAALIKVEYSQLPAIANIRKALAEDAPLLHAKACCMPR